MKELFEKLAEIQQRLVAGKSETNSFGKYNYRTCEGINEAVKPLLKELGGTITLSDTINEVGGRVFVEATATYWYDGKSHACTASAREAADKKGMDVAQITGAASSYARKYALSGLLLIDGNDDPDATNDHGKGKSIQPQNKPTQPTEHPLTLWSKSFADLLRNCKSADDVETLLMEEDDKLSQCPAAWINKFKQIAHTDFPEFKWPTGLTGV